MRRRGKQEAVGKHPRLQFPVQTSPCELRSDQGGACLFTSFHATAGRFRCAGWSRTASIRMQRGVSEGRLHLNIDTMVTVSHIAAIGAIFFSLSGNGFC